MDIIKSLLGYIKTWHIIIFSIFLFSILLAVFLAPKLRQILRGQIGLDASLMITADSEDVLGITSDTTFTIKSDTPVSTGDLADSLTIDPPVDFTIDQIADNLYQLKPKDALADDNIYRIQFAGKDKQYSWAFQVKDTFRVLGTLPRHQSGGVPVNSGIEIILSSDQYQDPDKYITISPSVKGRFERHHRVLSFVPEKLQNSTLYTVTVKSGFSVSQTDKLASDYVFQFETSTDSSTGDLYRYYLNLNATHYQFSTTEKPVFDALVQDSSVNSEVVVYQFKTQDDYISAFRTLQSSPTWSYLARKQSQINTSSLSKVSQMPLKLETHDYVGYFSLPNALNQGYYLVEIKNDKSVSQSVFQVTNLSAYSEILDNKSVFWVNNVQNAQAVSGAQVSFMGNKCTTNASGLCEISTPASYAGTSLAQDIIITAGSDALVLVTGYSRQLYQRFSPFSNASDSHWSYLYTDRPIYQTTDLIQFYGLGKPRETDNTDKLTVTLKNSWGDIYAGNGVYYDSVQITPDSYHTFSGQFSIKNLKSGWYTLELRAADKIIATSSINITKYVKPSYTLSLTPDSYGVIAGDKLNFSATANFFEGTPLSELDLNLTSYYPTSLEQTKVTNSEGKASFVVDFPITSSNQGYSPTTATMVLKPQNPEIGDITATQGISVFSSAVYLRTEAKLAPNNTAAWTIRANSIDLTRVQDSYSYSEPAYISAPVVNRAVTLQLFEVWYDKIQTGEYYDFINKITVPSYQYLNRENQISTQTLNTNATGQIIFETPTKADVYYKLVASVTDDRGRITQSTAWYYPDSFSHISNQSNQPHLVLDQQKTYSVDAPVKYHLTRSGSPLPDNYRYLHLVKSRGLQEYQVTSSPQHEIKFKASYIPTAYLQTVVFTGGAYMITYEQIVSFDTTSRELNIEISSDKSRYLPGDKAKINVKITNAQGQPVKSSLNLSLVDEAIFAIAQSTADPLGQIYKSVSSGSRSVQFSHRLPLGSLMAEGGGGGGGDVRQKFPDTAYFVKLETNAQGQASVEIPLPDSITSWRLTTHAISADLAASSHSYKIPVSLDFFADILLPNTYHVQDQPMIGVRASSSTLPSTQAVEFQLVSTSLNFTQTLQGKMNQVVYFPISKLSDGVHNFVLTAKSGDKTDKIQKPVTVVSGYKEKYQTNVQSMTPGQGLTVPDTASTVYLNFVDGGSGRLTADLRSLSYDQSLRLDARLAAVSANRLLGQSQDEDLSDYYTDESGLALLPYASSDSYLSVISACQSTTPVDKIKLATAFYKHLDHAKTTLDEATLDTLGLACLGEKVLPMIKQFSKSNSLQDLSKIYLALASAKLGDHETARVLYKDYLLNKTDRVDEQLILKIGSAAEQLRNNYLFSWLGSLLSEESAKHYYQFASSSTSTEAIFPLEKLLYIESEWRKKQPENFRIELKINGQVVVVDSAKEQVLNLITDAASLKTLVVDKITGAPDVVVGYFGGFDSNKSTSGYSVSRTYLKSGQAVTSFSRNDLVRVNLAFSLPQGVSSGCTLLTDFLPSNMQPLTPVMMYAMASTEISYPSSIDGQKVTFCVTPTSKPISYLARITSPGIFVADSPLLQSLVTPSVFASGNPAIIEVK